MEVIVIESEAFHALINEIVEKVGAGQKQLDKWIDGEEAMQMLRIKSSSTLQKFRDEGKIEFSKVNAKTILYNRFSIDEFIEQNKQTTF